MDSLLYTKTTEHGQVLVTAVQIMYEAYTVVTSSCMHGYHVRSVLVKISSFCIWYLLKESPIKESIERVKSPSTKGDRGKFYYKETKKQTSVLFTDHLYLLPSYLHLLIIETRQCKYMTLCLFFNDDRYRQITCHLQF